MQSKMCFKVRHHIPRKSCYGFLVSSVTSKNETGITLPALAAYTLSGFLVKLYFVTLP